jgi:hypothetical protein
VEIAAWATGGPVTGFSSSPASRADKCGILRPPDEAITSRFHSSGNQESRVCLEARRGAARLRFVSCSVPAAERDQSDR